MKKHGFLYYIFIGPFLLIFMFYKYLFIGLSRLFEYIVDKIVSFFSNHPVHFRSFAHRIKGLILYCYNRSVVVSRIMYISVLALNILFTGLLFNSCSTVFQYAMASLFFICMLIISVITTSLIFYAIYKIIIHFKPRHIVNTEAISATSENMEEHHPVVSSDVTPSLSPSGSKAQTHPQGNEATHALPPAVDQPSTDSTHQEPTKIASEIAEEHRPLVFPDVTPSLSPSGSEAQTDPQGNVHSHIVTDSTDDAKNVIDSEKTVQAASDIITNKTEYIPQNNKKTQANLDNSISISNTLASEENFHLPSTASYTVSFEALCKYIIEKGDATVSILQNTFGINFFEACDLFSKLENYGIVGPDCPPSPRAVFISIDELYELFSNGTICDEDKKKTYKTNSPIIYDIIESDGKFKTVLKKYHQNKSTPYWKQLPNSQRMQFEQNNLDLTAVTIFFHNGIICQIVPDVQCYCSARYYVMNGAFFDTYSLEDVNAIPVPPRIRSYGTPVYNLDYLLKMRASQERDKKNFELSYALMYKSIECMIACDTVYSKKEYMRFITWLYKDGRFDEADRLENRLRRQVPESLDINLFHKNYFMSQLQQCKSLDTDYIYCGGHPYTCGECAKYQHRVYCLSGNDTSFPKLPDFVYEYGGFHTGCRHSFYPYFGGSITDKNGAQVDALEYSNRPFEDDRTPEEIEGYNKYIEKIEKEKLRDENLEAFYILRYELPDIMPKSFSTFMKYRSQNSAKYISILNAAKEKGITSPLL